MSQLERIYATTALIACIAMGVAAAPSGTEAVELGKRDTARAFLAQTQASLPDVLLDGALNRAHALFSIGIDASDAQAVVTLELTGMPHYQVLRSEGNNNLFLDLSGAIVVPEPSHTAVSTGSLLTKVTTQLLAVEPQFVTRVEIGLRVPVNFELRASGNTVALLLRPTTSAGESTAVLASAREILVQQEAAADVAAASADEIQFRMNARIAALQHDIERVTADMTDSLADMKVQALSSQFASLSKAGAADTSALDVEKVKIAGEALTIAADSVAQLVATRDAIRRNLTASLLVNTEGIRDRVDAHRTFMESNELSAEAIRVIVADIRAAGAMDAQLFESLLTQLARHERNTVDKFESILLSLRARHAEQDWTFADVRFRDAQLSDPLSLLAKEVARLRSRDKDPMLARLLALDAALESVALEDIKVPVEPALFNAAITDEAPESAQGPPRRRARATTPSPVFEVTPTSVKMRMLTPTEREIDIARATGMLVLAQADRGITEASDLAPKVSPIGLNPTRIALPTARANRPSFNLYNRDLPPEEDPLQALVNIDFRQMDLTNVVSLLAQKAKINVIAGAEVSGSVTANLQDIPLGRAIEIILRMNGLGIIEEEGVYRITSYDEAVTSRRETRMLFLKNASATEVQDTLSNVLSGTSASGLLSISANATTNVIILSGPRDLVGEYESIIAQLDIAEPVIPTITVPIKLNYAEPQALLAVVAPLLTDAGKVTADLRGRHLIVTDLPVKVEDIQALIERIDLPVKQVSIEAMIVDALMADDAETGVDWILRSVRRTNRRGQVVGDVENVSFESDFTTGNISPGFVPGVNLGGQLAFGILTGDFDIRAAIGAEVRSDNARLLANPVIVTVENKTARISIAEEIPFQELTQSTTGPPISSTEFKEVGTILEVTPRVTHDNHIIIDIFAKQSDTKGESITGIPPEDIREANTTVRLKSGQTVFIGGLRRFDDEITVRKVPILGDIPILSALFRNQKVVKENLELLIFLTCHVLSDEIPDLTPDQKNWFDALGTTVGKTPDATRALLHSIVHPGDLRDPIYKWRRKK